jgi:hypothetical protein
MSNVTATETRPAWAQGEEWEGWKLERSLRSNQIYARRKCGFYYEFWIGPNWLTVTSAMDYAKYTFGGADALEVANLIAAKLGGWK